MLDHSPFVGVGIQEQTRCLSSEVLKDVVVTMTFSGKLF